MAKLIGSLKTTDHSEAMRRVGPAYRALEIELKELMVGKSFREKIEIGRQPMLQPGETSYLLWI